jgi:hypothetical protein
MRFSYSAFGLTLAADRPLPLVPQSQPTAPDTLIWLAANGSAPKLDHLPADPWYISEEEGESTPALRVWRIANGLYYKWLYDDGPEFLVDGSGSEIWATWPKSLTLEDAATYLLGPILGFVLRLRQTTCLHGSAVAIAGRALVLVGPAAAGKSTLAAALGRLGYPVLSDDVAALVEWNDQWYVQPAYPQLRLWPQSVALLFGSDAVLPPLTPTWDKRVLRLVEHGYRFEERPTPIVSIYVLGERTARAAPCIQRLQGRELLRTLVANTYVGYALDATMRHQEFSTLGRLAGTVPVRKVLPCDDPSRLCNAIIEDCEALGCTVSPTTGR